MKLSRECFFATASNNEVNNHYVYRKLINGMRTMTNVSSLKLTFDAYITYQQNRLKDNTDPWANFKMRPLLIFLKNL